MVALNEVGGVSGGVAIGGDGGDTGEKLGLGVC